MSAPAGFNLSILECKSRRKLLGTARLQKVLIYPYWNVNNAAYKILKPTPFVLIYPYWNVNTSSSYRRTETTASFNLSILECKLRAPLSNNRQKDSFNLSILECKLSYCIHTASKPQGFNLSILECKCIVSAFRFDYYFPVLIYPYWNVNLAYRWFCNGNYIVLIYPYWNVNYPDEVMIFSKINVLIYPYWNVNL